MAGPYRDGGGSLEERLAALDEAIAEQEAIFTPHFWELAAPSLGLSRPVGPKDLTRAERKVDIADRVAARQDRLEKLELAARQLDALEGRWRSPSETTPPVEPRYTGAERALTGPADWAAVRDRFAFIAGNLFPEGRVQQVGPYAMSLSVAAQGTPVAVLCDYALVSTGQGSGQTWELQIVAQASVSPLAGDLDVRPQGIGDEFLGLFGLRKEHVMGDYDFDGMFFVRGEEAAARGLLTDGVRGALLIIAREAVPHLVVGGGLARLRWAYEPRAPALEAALDVLAALRRAEPTRSLCAG